MELEIGLHINEQRPKDSLDFVKEETRAESTMRWCLVVCQLPHRDKNR